MGRLENRTAIITGGHTEISREIARRFMEEGATIILAGKDEEGFWESCKDLDPTGKRVHGIVGDGRKEEDLKRIVKAALQGTGRIDILINHSDLMAWGPVTRVDPELLEDLMDANAHAPWRLMVAVVPEMRKAGGGAIVNISSIAGTRAFSGRGVYCASHAAFQLISQTLAKEVSPDNIRVNLICPAVVEDEERGGPQEVELRGRNGNPKDVADAALFLVSDESAWLTGLTIDLDGGRHLYPTPAAK